MTANIKIVHLEETTRRIDDSTPIVRYMKLETLLLLLFERRAFIPSHATLGRLDPLETGILFDIPTFWQMWEHRIEPRVENFVHASQQRDYKSPSSTIVRSWGDGFVQRNFRKYVDELATERCIWCWNEFTNYSNALWRLYGERGVAITSTVGEVKEALVKAGVERGIVAPIAYIDHENSEVSNLLLNEEKIFRFYLLKSVAYNYEKEIRFVLAARREILRDKGGVLVHFKEADFFKNTISPHMNKEERLVVETIITAHRNKSPEERWPPSSDSNWTNIYNSYGTPFTTQDSLPNVFSDIPPMG
jgi:hypothetical protein